MDLVLKLVGVECGKLASGIVVGAVKEGERLIISTMECQKLGLIGIRN